MRIDAFTTTYDENMLFQVIYYHMPNRWEAIDKTDLNIPFEDWSAEIKYLAANDLDVSEEVKNLPEDVGGIYIFFIKGVVLPYFETYLAYIGRAQFTTHQNLKKRCNSYYYEYFKKSKRPKIKRLIGRWGKYLYLRYYALTDNERIKNIEAKIINGILPPFNDEIPDLVYKEPEPAF